MIKGLPEKLKELRWQANLSQRDVAKRLGVSPSIISGYETGERTPSAENLLALSFLYKCSTDYLLGKDDAPPHVFLDKESGIQVMEGHDLVDLIISNANKLSDKTRIALGLSKYPSLLSL